MSELKLIGLESLKSFFSGIAPLLENYKEYEKKHAPDYNIFSILKIKSKEVIVHTPFLADLLDLYGEHKQKDLYFKLFVEACMNNSLEISNITLLRTFQEEITRFGIIDILISCQHNSLPYYILIENKVHANDGKKQLERYYNFLTQSIKLDKSQYTIIYLTPNGSIPEIPTSINRDLYDDLKRNDNLIEISYNEDIVSWIYRCIEVTKPESVKQILNQYLHTIKSL